MVGGSCNCPGVNPCVAKAEILLWLDVDTPLVLDEIVSLDAVDELAITELLTAELFIAELLSAELLTLELAELVDPDESLPPQPTSCIKSKSALIVKIALRISISPKILHRDEFGSVWNI